MKSYLLKIWLASLWGILQIPILTAQIQSGTWCNTPVREDVLERINLEQFQLDRTTSVYSVKLFIHIINETNGTGGISEAALYEELALVQAAFDPICLYVVGIDEINDSYFGSQWNNSKGPEIDSIYGHPNAINAYIVPPSVPYGGNAFSIPNRFFAMGGRRLGLGTFAHELGHCLGLFHTHEPAFGIELVNGGNCLTAGDKLCDTPADPQLNTRNVDFTTCSYIGTERDPIGDLYNADPTNLMSYAVHSFWGISCRQFFTPDQIFRMWAILHTTLSDVLVPHEEPLLLQENIVSGTHLIADRTSITAGNPLFLPPYDYVVTGSAYVTHTAGEYVNLIPGFRAAPSTGGFYLASVSNVLCNSISSSLPPEGASDASKLTGLESKRTHRVDEEGFQVQIYPNPFYEQLTVEFQSLTDGSFDISVRNALGQIVEIPWPQKRATSGIQKYTIRTSRWPSGIYFLELRKGNRREVTKIIKK